MLNQHLPFDQLYENLDPFIDSWELLLKSIDPDIDLPLRHDKDLLGQLHHALNIDQYSNHQFRSNLLKYAPSSQFLDFVQKSNISYTNADIDDVEFRKRSSRFVWSNNDITKSFVSAFQYPDYLIPHSVKPVPAANFIPKSIHTYTTLKDYQAYVYFKARQYAEYPNSKIVVQMPTGSGKTRVAMEIVSSFLNSNKSRTVVWLADRSELCEQAYDTFLAIWPHVAKCDLTISRLWGKHPIPDLDFDHSQLIIAMYQKIRNPLFNEQLSLKADLIVADEAHNALAPTYQKIIKALCDIFYKQTKIIGLSATPGRTKHSDKLADFFDNQIITIDSGVQSPISYLQDKNILSRCIRKPLQTKRKFYLTKDEWNQIQKSFNHEYPDSVLKKIADDVPRNLKIVQKLLELSESCKHIIVFNASVRQSKLLCGLLIALGKSAIHVDGSTPHNYRHDVINKFKNGDIQFIFNYDIFTTGFDAPNIDAVVIARPTTSVVVYGQMIGRGMRGLELGGTEEFQLIDVVDNIITEYGGLDDVYEYFSAYWDT